MPPRTGPRRRKRTKASPPAPLRHFVLVFDDRDAVTGVRINDLVIANRLELADGYLMLHDANDAVFRIVARGEWREIRPATIEDIPYAEDPDKDALDNPADYSGTMQREEATLTEVTRGTPPEDTLRQESARFVPSSPEEAQRILMELERRLKPDYQDPPDCADAPPPPVAPRKD